MAKTSVELNEQKVAQVREILGTTTTRSTLEAALDQVIRDNARQKFLEMGRRGAFADLLDPEFEREMWSSTD